MNMKRNLYKRKFIDRLAIGINGSIKDVKVKSTLAVNYNDDNSVAHCYIIQEDTLN